MIFQTKNGVDYYSTVRENSNRVLRLDKEELDVVMKGLLKGDIVGDDS